MIVSPVLQKLRRCDRPQRQAQAAVRDAMAAWRSHPDVAPVLQALEDFRDNRPLRCAPALAKLFESPMERARAFADGFVTALCAPLLGHPLGHVPARHYCDDALATLMITRSGAVTLSLVAVDGAALAQRAAPQTADFSPSESWERVLAGRGEGELVCKARTGPASTLSRQPLALRPGTYIYRDATQRTLLVHSVRETVITLRLQRARPAGRKMAEEYRLSDGALVHRAAGSARESRSMMLMELAGRMGQAGAVPHLDRIARSRGGDAARWLAIRECLALDTAHGFALLTDIAGNPEDPLSAVAGSLRAQLIEAHPTLAEVAQCPA